MNQLPNAPLTYSIIFTYMTIKSSLQSLFLFINKATVKLVEMERKRIEIIAGLMLVMAMLSVRSITAHLPPGACIKHCLKECKLSGIDVAVCIKYCPVHCLPPDTSTKEHYCNLGCMLDKCAKFTKDEKEMSECVSKCHKSQCKIKV